MNIRSTFAPGSAIGGTDGLRPQHLKDMIHPKANGGVQVLLAALSRFVSLVIHGRVPDFARHLFFGARLTALSKEDGGVRPIAVGLVAKVAGYHHQSSKHSEDWLQLNKWLDG